MRTPRKGEIKAGMTVYHRNDGLPYHVNSVQDRGSYDVLSVSRKSKSGKVAKKWGTGGHDDFLI